MDLKFHIARTIRVIRTKSAAETRELICACHVLEYICIDTWRSRPCRYPCQFNSLWDNYMTPLLPPLLFHFFFLSNFDLSFLRDPLHYSLVPWQNTGIWLGAWRTCGTPRRISVGWNIIYSATCFLTFPTALDISSISQSTSKLGHRLPLDTHLSSFVRPCTGKTCFLSCRS